MIDEGSTLLGVAGTPLYERGNTGGESRLPQLQPDQVPLIVIEIGKKKMARRLKSADALFYAVLEGPFIGRPFAAHDRLRAKTIRCLLLALLGRPKMSAQCPLLRA
jgi:hypothetical protein